MDQPTILIYAPLPWLPTRLSSLLRPFSWPAVPSHSHLPGMMSSDLLLTVLTHQSVSSTTEVEKRAASCTFPSPSKSSSLTAAKTIASGVTFDGGNVRYDRGSGACEGQTEGGDSDAVFLLQTGATLQ